MTEIGTTPVEEPIEEPVAPTPMVWDRPRETARAAIAERGLTVEDVRALGYRETAALMGVEIVANGNSPEWFCYSAEKNVLAAEMEAAATEAALTEMAQRVLDSIGDAEIEGVLAGRMAQRVRVLRSERLAGGLRQ
jgi:hypothetical protein